MSQADGQAATEPTIPQAIVDLVISSFAFPDAFHFEDLERRVSGASFLVAPAAKVALDNLKSAVAVSTVPFLMAQTAVIQMRYRQLHIAEQIRQGQHRPSNGDPTKEMIAEAHALASKRLSDEQSSPDSVRRFAEQCVYDLSGLVRDPSFKAAAHELLLETVVMLWGALEVFLGTVIRSSLNADPSVALKLFSTEGTKKHFPSRGIAVEALAERGFDVSSSMGDVLLAGRHLDSLAVIKDIADVIWPSNEALRAHLGDSRLWRFAQRRHLVVHRRGEIDSDYLARTGETLPVGSRLAIKSDYVAECFQLVCGVVAEVLNCYPKQAMSASR